MSDSSEEEDLSQFKDAIDTSFLTDDMFQNMNGNNKKVVAKPVVCEKRKSERYLVAESHYNDVRVTEELQNRIGKKLSSLIANKVEFVEVECTKMRKPKVKGGVKLFSDSSAFATADVAEDLYTEQHNRKSKACEKKKRKIVDDIDEASDRDKIEMVAVSGDHILSRDETKHWKSRRKEKLFKYKSRGKSKICTAVEDKD